MKVPLFPSITICHIVYEATFFSFCGDKRWKPFSICSQEQRLVRVELLTPGLILPQLVYWYWLSPSAASKCNQLEAKRMGQIKQTCCFGFCRLSAWYSDAGVSVMLIPASGVHCKCTDRSVHVFALCQWSQLLMKWSWAKEAYSFFFIKLCLAVKHVVFEIVIMKPTRFRRLGVAM